MEENSREKEELTDAEAGAPSTTRRTCLKLAGLTAASAVGIGAIAQDGSRAAPTMTGYTYGGTPLLSKASTQTPTAIREVEPNDDRGEAMLIDPNVPVTGALVDSEVDWYAVHAVAGDELTVTFERSSASGVTAIVLYGPDGDFLDQLYVGNDDPATVTETASADGVHFVEIVDLSAGDDDYTIIVDEGSAAPTPTSTATPTVTETASPTPTATPTQTSTSTSTPVEDDYGQVGYGEYGYGGVVT